MLPRPALVVLVLALVPVASALPASVDVHAGAFEASRACEGERDEDSWTYSWDGTTYTYETSSWNETCSESDDVLAARIDSGGETLAEARAGDRFEGRSEGSSWSTRASGPDGDTSDENRYDITNGTTTRGARLEAVGEEARADVARCEGTGSDYVYEYGGSRYEGTGHDETCEAGVFAGAAGQEAEAGVLACYSWGYGSTTRSGPGVENESSYVVDYRSCQREERVDLGPAGHTDVMLWSGHYEDCSTGWNGTAQETSCGWYSGEWTGFRIEGRLLGLWLYEEEYVPYEVDVLP